MSKVDTLIEARDPWPNLKRDVLGQRLSIEDIPGEQEGEWTSEQVDVREVMRDVLGRSWVDRFEDMTDSYENIQNNRSLSGNRTWQDVAGELGSLARLAHDELEELEQGLEGLERQDYDAHDDRQKGRREAELTSYVWLFRQLSRGLRRMSQKLWEEYGEDDASRFGVRKSGPMY